MRLKWLKSFTKTTKNDIKGNYPQFFALFSLYAHFCTLIRYNHHGKAWCIHLGADFWDKLFKTPIAMCTTGKIRQKWIKSNHIIKNFSPFYQNFLVLRFPSNKKNNTQKRQKVPFFLTFLLFFLSFRDPGT